MNSEFFNVKPVQLSLATLFDLWTPRQQTENIDPRNALDRTTAVPTGSPIDLPSFRRSAMDGFAVRAADTYGASQTLPAYLIQVGAIGMGAVASTDINTGEAVEIHTGGMLPPGADAVVMVEQTQRLSDSQIEILAPVAPGENVVEVGEDVASGATILPAGHRIRPQDIGGLLAVGLTSIVVVARPRVGILSCGDELVLPKQQPQPGQIRDINAFTLAALVQQAGGEPIALGIARDQLSDYQTRAQDGFERSDILVMTAGSSVSTRDLTYSVIDDLGDPGVIQHGLAVKPGKPTILAVCDNKPVIGLPGNPVSALLVAHQILVPIIRRALGQQHDMPGMVEAELTSNIASTTGREDTVPVRLTRNGDTLQAEPLFGKSNLIFTLVNADGLVHVPLNSTGLKAGSQVKVVRF